MTVKKETIKSKKDAFEIFDGAIKIYRTTSKIWQHQMWVRDEQKYVRESLHAEDKEVAINRARERFIYYRARIQQNEKIFSITANELRNKYLEHISSHVQQNQLSKGRESNIKTFTKLCVDFVGKQSKIQNIDPKLFRGYLAFRRNSKDDILAAVVINESVTIKQMYKFAIDEEYIGSSYRPDFGVMKKQHYESVRESYTSDDYKSLINISRIWYKSGKNLSDEEKYYARSIFNEQRRLVLNARQQV